MLLDGIKCIGDTQMSSILEFMITLLFQGFRIIFPLAILIKATINLGKAKNSKEIAQEKINFTKTLVKATIIFLVLTFIQFGISLLAENITSGDMWACIKKLICF